MENDSKDYSSALQTYLNNISISSLPGIRDAPVLEVKAGDSLRDAIRLLYEKNAAVALVTDNSSANNAAISRLSDRYIGVISFASMVLWCIERLKKYETSQSQKEAGQQAFEGFISRLDQNPDLKQAKVGELAKYFLWDPYIPVHLEDDTLFQVLLLLSKHQLLVLPVIERATDQVIGFISQNAVVKFLLRSSGLEWFDSIANVSLSKFRFQRKNSVYQVYGDQSISEALLVLSENRFATVAAVDRMTGEVIGTVRKDDITLLNYYQLFSKSKTMTLAEFIKIASNEDSYNLITENQQHDLVAQSLRLRNNFIPRMDLPVIHKETDTLKQVMVKMTETNSESSFIVDESNRMIAALTFKDIIIEFAPPCLESRINGGGFFEFALQKTGCHIENGTLVSDQ
ncbi:SNF1-related protein kinase regulatory subunit gamma-1-like [Chenopodium quinoa]|uniref:SNF1-related protein kinase regulatory subunit gamma-1-like n=1 Tax=Chenopodium quinoa TaxID=63459 RepID=UPI000B789435|nr:SNF1-related protein kinase regulatory subunit gamma-1-like [Chenopodium quinoa]